MLREQTLFSVDPVFLHQRFLGCRILVHCLFDGPFSLLPERGCVQFDLGVSKAEQKLLNRISPSSSRTCKATSSTVFILLIMVIGNEVCYYKCNLHICDMQTFSLNSILFKMCSILWEYNIFLFLSHVSVQYKT